MALHKDFPDSPYAILEPDVRWFPADEALRETSMEKLKKLLGSNLRFDKMAVGAGHCATVSPNVASIKTRS
jgi:hypothetical protein